MSEYSSYVKILLNQVKQFSTKILSRGDLQRLHGSLYLAKRINTRQRKNCPQTKTEQGRRKRNIYRKNI